MFKGTKKIISAILLAAFVFSLAACADTSSALTVNGRGIAAGEYVYTQFTAISEALTKFDEEHPDVDTSVVGFNYYNYEIEGKQFRDWVVDETVKLCARREIYAGMFDELGLSFTDDENAIRTGEANTRWTVEDGALEYYYGITDFKTWGAFYESLGIGKSSFLRVTEDDAKSEKVFHAIYGEGGEKEVSDEDLKTYFIDNYARYRMFEVDLSAAADDTEMLAELETLANGYVDDLKNGELFSEVKAKYEAYSVGAAEEAEEILPEEDISDTDSDGTETGEEPEEEVFDENENDSLIEKTSVSPSEDFVKRVFEMNYNEPELIKTETSVYVTVRLDINDREDLFNEERQEALLHLMKNDEVIAEIDGKAAAINVERNEAALDLYEPRKLLI